MTDLVRHSRHWSIGVGRLGFSFFLTGLGLLFYSFTRPPIDGVGALVKETQHATYAELQEAPSGSLHLIEGVISERNESLVQGMVAYQRYHGVPDIRGDMVWSLEETNTPELQIDMLGGTVTVSAGYILFGEMPQVILETEQYNGVSVGDTVLVIGTLINSSVDTYLQATYVIHGSLEANQPIRFNMYTLWGGCILSIIGLAIMAGLLKLGYRPFGDRRTGR